MSSWNVSSPKTPCPVCSRTRDGDCLTHQDGETVLCRTRANPASKVEQPGDETEDYKFTGRIETTGVLQRAIYVKKGVEPTWRKPPSPKSDLTFEYPTIDGNPLVRTRRIDSGSGKKYIWQEYWIPYDRLKAYKIEGDWVKLSQKMVSEGKASKEDYEFYRAFTSDLEKHVHLYRITDPINQEAIKAGKQILIVEGETTVNALLDLGVPATTNIGGSKKFKQYGGKHDNYKADLKGAKIVLCPDCDKPGLDHCEQVSRELKDFEISWLYANPSSEIWKEPGIGEGYDLGNWIAELKGEKLDSKAIVEKIWQSVERKARTFKPETFDPGEKSMRELIEGGYVDSTAEHWVYDNLFEAGKGVWAVLDSTFYRYACGCWHRVEEQVVSRDVFKATLDLYTVTKEGERKYKFATNNTGKSCVEFARAILPPQTLPEESRYKRVFNNCTVDMRTGEQMPHSREHFATVAIDADYKENADCPKEFLDFVEKCYGLEMLPLIRAVTNMLLNPTAPWHFFVHLQGASGSGKGTLIHLWQSLFGRGQHSSCGKLSEISTPEGRHQYMTGVGLLAFPDVNGMIKDVTDFYELVDNGAKSGRALFNRNGYTKVWNTRFVMASVLPLRVENSGEGWDRRQILIPTAGYLLRDSGIDERLSQPEVKSDLISWALAMDSEDRDNILRNATTYDERIEELKHEAKMSGDPVQAFIDHCLRPSPGAPKIKSVNLHTYYNSYARAMGYADIGEKHFAQRLKGAIGQHYQGRRRAKKGESADTEYGLITAGWINVELLPGIFEISLGETICNKGRVEDGGLDAFKFYWESLKEECTQGTHTPAEEAEGCVHAESLIQLEFQNSCTQRTQCTQLETATIENPPEIKPDIEDKDPPNKEGSPDDSVHSVPCVQEIQDAVVEPVPACTQPDPSENRVCVPCVQEQLDRLTHGCVVVDLVTGKDALFDECQGDKYLLQVGKRFVLRSANEVGCPDLENEEDW